MPRRPIYMDHHATTPVDPRVLERMLPYFTEKLGNAASRSHAYGWEAEAGVEEGRKQLGSLIGADPAEIVFTSGATEANNLALFGVMSAYAEKGDHLITQATEHKAVLDVVGALRERGVRVSVLPVDATGQVSVAAIAAAIEPRTVLVSIMAANNEVGTLQPLADIGALCKTRGVLLHTDAAQAVGNVPFDVQALGVDLASISAHKLYGPKGVGALYVRRREPRVALDPQMLGGGHERGRRSGTLNVPGIVGLGAAAELAQREGAARREHLSDLRERLRAGLVSQLGDTIVVNGHPTQRLPGNLHVSFIGVEAEALMLSLRELAVSSGAACTSQTLAPSHVLLAMGLPADRAHGSIRFGLGAGNTADEVDRVIVMITLAVEKLARLSPRKPSGIRSPVAKEM